MKSVELVAVPGALQDGVQDGVASAASGRTRSTAEWSVWASWVGHTMAGVLAALILAHPALLARGGGFSVSAMAGLTGIAAVATAQSRVLRQYRPSLPVWRWVVAAVVGYVAAAIAGVAMLMVPALLGVVRTAAGSLGMNALAVVTTLTTGALFGVVTGFPSWLVLRRHFTGAGIWMLATAVAFAASAIVPPIDASVAIVGVPLATLGARVTQALIMAMSTGIVLVRMLRHGTPVRVARAQAMHRPSPSDVAVR